MGQVIGDDRRAHEAEEAVKIRKIEVDYEQFEVNLTVGSIQVFHNSSFFSDKSVHRQTDRGDVRLDTSGIIDYRLSFPWPLHLRVICRCLVKTIYRGIAANWIRV